MRNWGQRRHRGRSLWWPVLARNKKSVTANLRDERGQDLVRRLCAKADVLIENFRPGTLEKWGLGPGRASTDHPASDRGQGFQASARPGLTRAVPVSPALARPWVGLPLHQRLSGPAATALRYLAWGYPHGHVLPCRVCSLALYWRDALGGGKGQVVDAAISESCFTMMESSLPEYDAFGIVRQPSGTGLAKIAPLQHLPDQRWQNGWWSQRIWTRCFGGCPWPWETRVGGRSAIQDARGAGGAPGRARRHDRGLDENQDGRRARHPAQRTRCGLWTDLHDCRYRQGSTVLGSRHGAPFSMTNCSATSPYPASRHV